MNVLQLPTPNMKADFPSATILHRECLCDGNIKGIKLPCKFQEDLLVVLASGSGVVVEELEVGDGFAGHFASGSSA